MNDFIPALCLLIGMALGLVATTVVMRLRERSAYDKAKAEYEGERATLIERVQSRDQSLAAMTNQVQQQHADLHLQRVTNGNLERSLSQVQQELKGERQQNKEKLGLLNEAQTKLSDAFKALAADALNSNNKSFLELAKTNLETFQETAKGDLEKRQQAIDELVKPVKESLEKVDAQIQELEKARVGAYSGITEQIKSLVDGQTLLRTETLNLVRALRTPNVRGRWGEIQLKRVVELAGMQNHCDFYEQQSVQTEDGQLRPDLLVKLPAGRNIIVDAKAPLSAYLDAVETQDDETRKQKLHEHAQQIRKHLTALGKKSYFEQFTPTPEFVVMFIPGEAFFCAALMEDPELIEYGVDHNVIVATPTTLIALLKAVAYGWRQEQLAENAKEISELGKELYIRCGWFAGHIANSGDHLGKAVKAHNDAIKSLESKFLVQARRFKDLGCVASDAKKIELLAPIEVVPRQAQAPELIETSVSHDGSVALTQSMGDGEQLRESIKPR